MFARVKTSGMICAVVALAVPASAMDRTNSKNTPTRLSVVFEDDLKPDNPSAVSEPHISSQTKPTTKTKSAEGTRKIKKTWNIGVYR